MIEKSLAALKPLESFDKEVFIGNDEYSQEFCNFILTLSLIWNDLKNLMVFLEHVRSIEPKDIIIDHPKDMPITPLWGEISGVKIHIEKLFIALMFELFKLINECNGIIESKSFNVIYKQMSRNSRFARDILFKYARGKAQPKTDLGKALLMVRHKIANHYDKNEIFKGYKRKFMTHENTPYISRGNNMLEQRFYFADAAAQDYYLNFQEKVTADEFYKNVNLIKDSINFAIKDVVEKYIQKRSAWKKIN